MQKKSKTHLFEGVVLGPGNERRMLESYLRRTNKLANDPEWYNTITNTCTTNIVNHVNEVYPGRVPWAIGILMPGLSPKMLLKITWLSRPAILMRLWNLSVIDSISEKWDLLLTSEIGLEVWIRGFNMNELYGLMREFDGTDLTGSFDWLMPPSKSHMIRWLALGSELWRDQYLISRSSWRGLFLDGKLFVNNGL